MKDITNGSQKSPRENGFVEIYLPESTELRLKLALSWAPARTKCKKNGSVIHKNNAGDKLLIDEDGTTYQKLSPRKEK